MRELTMDDFKVDREKCKFHEHGIWCKGFFRIFTDEDGYEINYSSIVTYLIQIAGRFCESYASDLFLIWSCLEDRIKDKEYRGEKLILGFRRMGVDKNDIVVKNYNANPYYYRQIVVIEIEATGDEIDIYMRR